MIQSLEVFENKIILRIQVDFKTVIENSFSLPIQERLGNTTF